MDQRRALIVRVTGLLLACVAFGSVQAHPHKDIDQQVLLSVGPGAVTAQVRIAPSYTDGAAIFAHIDADGDGKVSASEAAAFGSAVMARASLRVDGLRFEFKSPHVAVPDREWVAAGLGLIEIDATAAINLTARAPHKVDFAMAYDELAHDWFIQPFYYPDLLSALPAQAIERSAAGNSVAIALAP